MDDAGQISSILREIHETLERTRADHQTFSKDLLQAVWEIRSYVFSLNSSIEQLSDRLRFDSDIMQSLKSIQGDLSDIKPAVNRIMQKLDDWPAG